MIRRWMPRPQDCAARLGLAYERRFTGYGDLATALQGLPAAIRPIDAATRSARHSAPLPEGPMTTDTALTALHALLGDRLSTAAGDLATSTRKAKAHCTARLPDAVAYPTNHRTRWPQSPRICAAAPICR